MEYQGLQYADSVTLQAIREDIYYIGKCNASFIGANDLNRIINKYYAQLQEAVRSVNENFYMVVATSDLTQAGQTVTYPDGNGTAPAYEKMKSIWIALNPANPLAPLDSEYERVNCIDPDQISDPAYQFTEPTALLFGTYFAMAVSSMDSTPYPVTNGFKVYYIATQDKLINDTDTPKIFPSFHDAITQGALIDVAERMGNTKLKADSVALFAKRLRDIQSYASGRLPMQVGVVEGQDNIGGWTFPWGRTFNGM